MSKDKFETDPLVFAPGLDEDLEKMEAEHPGAKKEMGELFALMRQAHQAWQAGQYKTFEDAMEALTGQRPERLDIEEEERIDELLAERARKIQ